MRKYARRFLMAGLWILLMGFNPGDSRSQGTQDPSNIILEVEQRADVTGADGTLHVLLRGRYGIVPAKEIAPNRQQYPGEVKDGDEFKVYLKYLGGEMVGGSASGGSHSVTLYDCSQLKKVYWQGAGQGHVEDKLANLGRIQGPSPDGSISLEVSAGAFSFSPCDNPKAPPAGWGGVR